MKRIAGVIVVLAGLVGWVPAVQPAVAALSYGELVVRMEGIAQPGLFIVPSVDQDVQQLWDLTGVIAPDLLPDVGQLHCEAQGTSVGSLITEQTVMGMQCEGVTMQGQWVRMALQVAMVRVGAMVDVVVDGWVDPHGSPVTGFGNLVWTPAQPTQGEPFTTYVAIGYLTLLPL